MNSSFKKPLLYSSFLRPIFPRPITGVHTGGPPASHVTNANSLLGRFFPSRIILPIQFYYFIFYAMRKDLELRSDQTQRLLLHLQILYPYESVLIPSQIL